MNLFEQILTEAISQDLTDALIKQGHTGPSHNVSTGVHQPKYGNSYKIIAALHDNTQNGIDGQGPYRITFFNQFSNGPLEPIHHIAYDTPEKAVQHFGIIKKFHSIGAAHHQIMDWLTGAEPHTLVYTHPSPKLRKGILAHHLIRWAPDKREEAGKVMQDITDESEKTYEEYVKEIVTSLTEALSPELDAELIKQGHTGTRNSTSIGNNPRGRYGAKYGVYKSVAAIHDNTQNGINGQGPHRITFLSQLDKDSPLDPDFHVAYDTPQKAVQHFGIIKKFHSIGVDNLEIVDWISAGGNTSIAYKGSTKPQREKVLANQLSSVEPEKQKEVSNVMQDITAESEKTYEEYINNMANSLIEDVLNVKPITHLEPIKYNTEPKKLTYHELCRRVACMAGV